MADSKPKDTTKGDQAAELKRQAAVEDAVHAATHDKDGDPIPLGGAELPQPPGIKVVEGKP